MAGALLSSEGLSFLGPIFGVEALGVPPAGVGAREVGKLLCTLLKLLVCKTNIRVLKYVEKTQRRYSTKNTFTHEGNEYQSKL